MKIHPSFVDLLACLLITYSLVVGLSLHKVDPATQEQVTPSLTLPKVANPHHGTGGVDGAVILSMRRNAVGSNQLVEYILEKRPIGSIEALIAEIQRLRPARLVIRGDAALTLSELTPILARMGELQVPISIAYANQPINKEVRP